MNGRFAAYWLVTGLVLSLAPPALATECAFSEDELVHLEFVSRTVDGAPVEAPPWASHEVTLRGERGELVWFQAADSRHVLAHAWAVDHADGLCEVAE